MVGRIYKEDYYTLLHTKYKSSAWWVSVVVSERKIFVCFSHCMSLGTNDPHGGAIFDPWPSG